MSEETNTGTGSIPPRLTIKKQEQNESESAESGAPEVTMSNPPLSLESKPTLNQDMGVPSNKKKTARITLDQVTAEPGASATVFGAGLASKTIRLAPAMTGQVSAEPLFSVGKAMTGMLVSDDAKRKTSRISLDSVLPQLDSVAAAGGDSAPKTIKIKRPTLSQPVTIRPPASVEAPAVGDVGAKSRTARVDIPQEENAPAEAQQTQKKTIKIRRADGVGADGASMSAPRTVSISRNEPEAAGIVSEQVAAPHWSFVVIAAAAVVMMCVMLYVLVSQAYPSVG